MQISELMTTNVNCIDPSASLCQAAQMMRDLDIGTLAVGDERRPSGILTDRDIVVRALADDKDPAATLVKEVATPHVCTVRADQDVREAAKIMAQEQVRRLMVLDHQQAPIGFVSIGDLARHAPDGAASRAVEGVSEDASSREG